MSANQSINFKKIDDYRWEIPAGYKKGMLVSGIIYADEKMLHAIEQDRSPEQVANVAFLPGIVGSSLAMPDIHWGYGFPIGGVAATRVNDGVVSPGGVGFDINCGVRLLSTGFSEAEVKPKIKQIIVELYRQVPSGLGSEGRIKLKEKQINQVLLKGTRWAVEHGYGDREDIEFSEEHGCLANADPDMVSEKAKVRGGPQLGTLGSGNHFLEIQVVEEIYNPVVAAVFGIYEPGQIMVSIHTGSRGLGYQVCDDYLKRMISSVHRYGINLPDRQLVCAPVQSEDGQSYLSAMACAANYAWANRQCITHWTREAFLNIFGPKGLKLRLVYDVAHNIAKIEEHIVNGNKMKLCVHRKGATRAFPAGNSEIPSEYRKVGQPVLIPGDMGRYSFVAVGTERAMQETFGSTCHGAGRLQSRSAAKKGAKGINIVELFSAKGIEIMASSKSSLAEEVPEAYKDVVDVVRITDKADISRKIAKLRPIGVIKG